MLPPESEKGSLIKPFKISDNTTGKWLPEENLKEQIEDGDPYGLAVLILPQVQKELSNAIAIIRKSQKLFVIK